MALTPEDLVTIQTAARLIADAERVRRDAREEGVDETVIPLANVPATELLLELARLLPEQSGRVEVHVAGPWSDDWRLSAAIGPCSFPLAACSTDIETVNEVRQGIWGTWDTGKYEARGPDTDGDEHTSGPTVSVHDTDEEARTAATARAVSLGWSFID